MILMKNYFEEINTRLKKQIEIQRLEIVDNSHKHRGHKFFSPDKFHLHLKIKSLYLKSISRVSAQKLIMKILKEDLKKKIHALEISIEQ
jgi:BolA family transcriptional regulator, general stress-responsive regulator